MMDVFTQRLIYCTSKIVSVFVNSEFLHVLLKNSIFKILTTTLSYY